MDILKVDFQTLVRSVQKFKQKCIHCELVLTLFIPPSQCRKQLDKLLKSLGFTQKKADSQVRWAVLNTILILRRHERARSQLAEAMSSGKSVGSCIDTIERSIDDADV